MLVKLKLVEFYAVVLPIYGMTGATNQDKPSEYLFSSVVAAMQ
jgi:hypothetical protein